MPGNSDSGPGESSLVLACRQLPFCFALTGQGEKESAFTWGEEGEEQHVAQGWADASGCTKVDCHHVRRLQKGSGKVGTRHLLCPQEDGQTLHPLLFPLSSKN